MNCPHCNEPINLRGKDCPFPKRHLTSDSLGTRLFLMRLRRTGRFTWIARWQAPAREDVLQRCLDAGWISHRQSSTHRSVVLTPHGRAVLAACNL